MSRVLLDASLPEKLREASDLVEVMDEAGRVLGVYTPIRVHLPPAGFQFPISDEELDRRNQVRTGRSLADILRDLEANAGGP